MFQRVPSEWKVIMPLISLTAFCKLHNLPKTSVHRYLKEECGFDLKAGLTLQAQETALTRFAKAPTQSAVAPEVSIGSDRLSRSLPLLGGTVDLSQFRRGELPAPMSDPDGFVDQMGLFLDQIEAGMDLAEATQEVELNRTRTLRLQGVRRLDKFRRRASEYRVTSSLLSQMQGAEVDELDSVAQEVSALGKGEGKGGEG